MLEYSPSEPGSDALLEGVARTGERREPDARRETQELRQLVHRLCPAPTALEPGYTLLSVEIRRAPQVLAGFVRIPLAHDDEHGHAQEGLGQHLDTGQASADPD